MLYSCLESFQFIAKVQNTCLCTYVNICRRKIVYDDDTSDTENVRQISKKQRQRTTHAVQPRLPCLSQPPERSSNLPPAASTLQSLENMAVSAAMQKLPQPEVVALSSPAMLDQISVLQTPSQQSVVLAESVALSTTTPLSTPTSAMRALPAQTSETPIPVTGKGNCRQCFSNC